MKCLKTQWFLHFSCREGILRVSFCTAWANSKLRKWYFVLVKRSFFITLGKKGLEIVLHQEIPCPYGLGASFFYQLCHKHAGSSSKIEPVMGALCDYASIGSFAPISNDFRWFHHGICLFGQKRSASMFAKLSVWSQVAGCLRQQSGS